MADRTESKNLATRSKRQSRWSARVCLHMKFKCRSTSKRKFNARDKMNQNKVTNEIKPILSASGGADLNAFFTENGIKAGDKLEAAARAKSAAKGRMMKHALIIHLDID